MIEIVVSIKEPLAEGKIYCPSSGSDLRGVQVVFYYSLSTAFWQNVYLYDDFYFYVFFVFGDSANIWRKMPQLYPH